MRCREVKRLLSSYIDGEISTDKRQEIEEHLSYCIDCKRELIILEKIIKEIHNIPEILPSDDFSEKVWIKYISKKDISSNLNFKKLLLLLGAAAIFISVVFIIRNRINSFINQPEHNPYIYYELHGKMLTSTFTPENNLVDLVLYRGRE